MTVLFMEEISLGISSVFVFTIFVGVRGGGPGTGGRVGVLGHVGLVESAKFRLFVTLAWGARFDYSRQLALFRGGCDYLYRKTPCFSD